MVKICEIAKVSLAKVSTIKVTLSFSADLIEYLGGYN